MQPIEKYKSILHRFVENISAFDLVVNTRKRKNTLRHLPYKTLCQVLNTPQLLKDIKSASNTEELSKCKSRLITEINENVEKLTATIIHEISQDEEYFVRVLDKIAKDLENGNTTPTISQSSQASLPPTPDTNT